MAYNLETVLAEKLETMYKAFWATCEKRGSGETIRSGEKTLLKIRQNRDMQELWKNYQAKFPYAADISWLNVMDAVAVSYTHLDVYKRQFHRNGGWKKSGSSC